MTPAEEAQTRAACDPAIEPWQRRALPPLCDCDAWGYMCDQGRRCPHRAPAEACTEVGAEAQLTDSLDSALHTAARLARAIGLTVLALAAGLGASVLLERLL
jgi:hypothetical protein